jgi:hypothetical protein
MCVKTIQTIEEHKYEEILEEISLTVAIIFMQRNYVAKLELFDIV